MLNIEVTSTKGLVTGPFELTVKAVALITGPPTLVDKIASSIIGPPTQLIGAKSPTTRLLALVVGAVSSHWTSDLATRWRRGYKCVFLENVY